jgi:Zn-dependent protease
VLYALGQPVDFVLLVLSFVVAVTLHGWVQARAAQRAGDRTPAQEGGCSPTHGGRSTRSARSPAPSPASAGRARWWSPQRMARGRLAGVLLAGTVANAVVGIAALVAFRAVGGPPVSGSTLALQQGVGDGDLHLVALYLFGLSNVFLAALSLVPLPPLPGGTLLFALAPHTTGWQKVRYRLIEQNIGVAVLLVLLLIPLGGPQALLPTILDSLVGPLLTLLLGG